MIPSREWASRVAACTGPSPSWDLLEALDKLAALIQQNALETAMIVCEGLEGEWAGTGDGRDYKTPPSREDCVEAIRELLPKA